MPLDFTTLHGVLLRLHFPSGLIPVTVFQHYKKYEVLLQHPFIKFASSCNVDYERLKEHYFDYSFGYVAVFRK